MSDEIVTPLGRLMRAYAFFRNGECMCDTDVGHVCDSCGLEDDIAEGINEIKQLKTRVAELEKELDDIRVKKETVSMHDKEGE